MVDATFHQLYDQPRYEKLLQRAAAFQARFRPAVCQFANRIIPLFRQFANRKQGRFRQFANLMTRRDAELLASPSDKERATRNGRPTASPWRMLAPSPRCAPRVGLRSRYRQGRAQWPDFCRRPGASACGSKSYPCSSLCGVARLYCREVSNGKQLEIANCLLRVK